MIEHQLHQVPYSHVNQTRRNSFKFNSILKRENLLYIELFVSFEEFAADGLFNIASKSTFLLGFWWFFHTFSKINWTLTIPSFISYTNKKCWNSFKLNSALKREKLLFIQLFASVQCKEWQMQWMANVRNGNARDGKCKERKMQGMENARNDNPEKFRRNENVGPSKIEGIKILTPK